MPLLRLTTPLEEAARQAVGFDGEYLFVLLVCLVVIFFFGGNRHA